MRFIVMAILVGCGGGGQAPASVQPPVQPPAAPVVVKPPSLVPDTPAGKLLGTWLDVFNSADEPRMSAFVAAAKYPQPSAELVVFRNETGGFELLRVPKSEPHRLTFVVKEKAGETTAIGWLRVKAAAPTEIESFTLLAIPPGMTAETLDLTVDAPVRAQVIDGAIATLHELYIFPETAKKMEQALRAHQKSGDYDAIIDGPSLAGLLTEHLQAVSKDRHLRVQFTPRVLPEKELEPTDADKAQMREQFEKMNCGFAKTEKLDGNIGYIKFDMFGDADICGPKATAAFAALGNDVTALIIDLRQNGGGQPAMVAFVTSYLFAKRTHLNDIYDRKENKTEQFWTKPDVPGTKFAKQPVYVLTSRGTFSGAEEFAYNLKALKRATIIGETTGGGAHPTMGKRIHDRFMLFVPFARAINPITKKNWEGTGVEPDVKVPADEALEKAKQLASEKTTKTKK